MQLTAYPRIHVGLADMGFASQRAFGGVGFAIEHPTTVVDFAPSDVFRLSGVEQLDEVGRLDLDHIFENIKKPSGVRPFHAMILRHPPQHSGFGSKTSLALSLISGANHFCSIGLKRHE